MNITINGRRQQLPGPVGLAELVRETTGDAEAMGVAVAVNGRVVPRPHWPTQQLTDGDNVEILRAVAGG